MSRCLYLITGSYNLQFNNYFPQVRDTELKQALRETVFWEEVSDNHLPLAGRRKRMLSGFLKQSGSLFFGTGSKSWKGNWETHFLPRRELTFGTQARRKSIRVLHKRGLGQVKPGYWCGPMGSFRILAL